MAGGGGQGLLGLHYEHYAPTFGAFVDHARHLVGHELRRRWRGVGVGDGAHFLNDKVLGPYWDGCVIKVNIVASWAGLARRRVAPMIKTPN